MSAPHWAATEWGKVNHAIASNGYCLCGLHPSHWYPPEYGAPPCKRCDEMRGPAMPPPPK